MAAEVETVGDWQILEGPGPCAGQQNWHARHRNNKDLYCTIVDDSVNVYEDISYYPSGDYTVPLSLIDRLRELETK